MAQGNFIAPTALMLSGQRSRTSIIQGMRRNHDKARPLKAVKNWGEVATMTSVLTNSPVRNDVTLNEMKSTRRLATPRLAAM